MAQSMDLEGSGSGAPDRRQSERRAAMRARLLKGGKIIVGKGIIPCTVRNISDIGACLQLSTTVGVPASFGFVMAESEARACRVVWRTETRLGIHFED
jgi:hypothetical protein